jgi:hypothetical protein
MFNESGNPGEHKESQQFNPDWSLSPEMSASRSPAAIEASKSRFSMLLSSIETSEQN